MRIEVIGSRFYVMMILEEENEINPYRTAQIFYYLFKKILFFYVF